MKSQKDKTSKKAISSNGSWDPAGFNKESVSQSVQMRQTSGVTGNSLLNFLEGHKNVQKKPGKTSQPTSEQVHQVAASGLQGSSRQLPHLKAIQKSFGGHDVTGVQAHVGGPAKAASEQMSAVAYATGNAVAFKQEPTLHTAAHEAAHIVQQRGGVQLKGGVGQVGDKYEHHADAVADMVVQGKSAESLLSTMSGPGGFYQPLQHKPLQLKKVPGNTFGNWNIKQTNTDAPAPGGTYASEVVIDFNPTDKANSPEIAFVQDVIVEQKGGGSADPRDNFKNRMTEGSGDVEAGHTVDRVDNRKHGWYGYNNDGTASGKLDKDGNFESGNISPGTAPDPLKSAKLYDRPSWSAADTSWRFEVHAISKSGPQANKLYGGLKWGFDVDADNKLTARPNEHLDSATATFDAAVDAWNDQASGDASKRNHADQQALGPFS